MVENIIFGDIMIQKTINSIAIDYEPKPLTINHNLCY